MKMNRNWIKNWDGVRERFAILKTTVSVKSRDTKPDKDAYKYTINSKRVTWMKTNGTSTTTWARA